MPAYHTQTAQNDGIGKKQSLRIDCTDLEPSSMMFRSSSVLGRSWDPLRVLSLIHGWYEDFQCSQACYKLRLYLIGFCNLWNNTCIKSNWLQLKPIYEITIFIFWHGICWLANFVPLHKIKRLKIMGAIHSLQSRHPTKKRFGLNMVLNSRNRDSQL